MNRVLNAFESVRPRGADAPSAMPRAHNVGRAPAPLNGSLLRDMALDRNGKRLVPLPPRINPGGFIEGRERSQASNDKRQSILRGGI